MSLNTHREARGWSWVAPSAKTRGEGHSQENQKFHRNTRSSLILSPVPRRAPVGTAARAPLCLPKLQARKDSPPPAHGGTAAPCGEHMLNVKTRWQFILRQFFFLTVYFLLEEAGAFPILAASTANRLAEV